MTEKNIIPEPSQRDYDIISGKITASYNEQMAAYVRINNKNRNNAINEQLNRPSVLDQPIGSIDFGIGEGDDPVDPEIFKETPEEKAENEKIAAEITDQLIKEIIANREKKADH